MPCDSDHSRRRRFAAYLDDIRHRRPLGRDIYHAYPQAMKVDAINPAWRREGKRYNAIGRMEDGVTSFLQQLVALVSETPVQRPTVDRPIVDAMEICFNEDAKNSSHASMHHSLSSDACAVELSEELEREVCAIYATDFACFGYELPASCLR